MENNVKIQGVGTYHPPVPVDNEELFTHFDSLGVDTRGLARLLGRKTRYFITDENENALTMGINAAKAAIKNAKIHPEDIDMIVFISETPEYMSPSTALKIHNAVGAVNARYAYDMNTNCIGMLVAMDVVSKFMKSTPDIQNVLIVASIFASLTTDPDHPFLRMAYSDGAGAIILQKIEEPTVAGIIDATSKVESNDHNLIVYPKAGITKVLGGKVEGLESKLHFVDHSADYFSDEWVKLIHKVLKRNRLTPQDVNLYVFSQLANTQNLTTLRKMDVEPTDDNYVFVGDKYGYTGASCIAFALEEARNQGKVKQGDYVLFVSVSTGYAMSVVLYRA